MFRDMHYIYAVYQEKSFTRAARKLYLSQPALSAMVKKVENKLGVSLFDRSTSPLTLTPSGQYYISQAEKIMAIQKESEEYFRQLADSNSHELRLGGSSFFQIYVFPPIISAFRSLYPDVTVSWVEAPNKTLLQKLYDRQIDAFPEVDNLFSDSVDGIQWDEEHLLLAVPAGWEINEKLSSFRISGEDILSGKRSLEQYPAIDPAEFSDCPFILMREGNDSYIRAMQICQNAGFSPQRLPMAADQMLTAFYLADQGNGIVFIRDSIVYNIGAAHSRLFYYRLADPAATRPVYFYFRRKDDVSPMAYAFRNFVAKYRSNSSTV